MTAPSSTSGKVSTYNLSDVGTFTPPSAGTWCFLASYAGDDTYNPVTAESDPGAECFPVNPATTTTGTSAALTGSAVLGSGGTITDTATVTGNTVAGFPSGSVAFFECGPSVAASTCASSGTPYNTVTLSGTGDSATAMSAPAFTPTSGVGFYCFAAVYTPTTANYSGSAHNTTGQAVDSEECVHITAASTGTGTSAALTGSAVIGAGGTITDTATVTGNTVAGFPSGSVAFFECGPSVAASTCASSGTPYNTVTLSGTGDSATAMSAPAFTPTSGVGFYCFAAVYTPTTANYSGSAHNTTGQAVDSEECVDITAATTTTGTSAALTGSAVLGSGGTITDTATVTGNTVAGFPSGSVAFFECGPSVAASTCASSGTPYNTVTLSGTGDSATAMSAPAFTPTSGVGFYCFAAVYTPTTANYSGSAHNTTGQAVDSEECVHITAASTGTGTSAALTGSAVIGAGGTITDTATVTGNTVAGFPSGSVAFFECGPSVAASTCASSGTPYNTVTLSGTGDLGHGHVGPGLHPDLGRGLLLLRRRLHPDDGQLQRLGPQHHGPGRRLRGVRRHHRGHHDHRDQRCADRLGCARFWWDDHRHRHGDGQHRRRVPLGLGRLLRVRAQRGRQHLRLERHPLQHSDPLGHG